MPASVTPMIEQYLEIKAQYQDAILFYRMGDFYEMFFKDAEIAAPLLDIALTSRNKKDDKAIPMCGIPQRAAQNYIARLIAKGCKVAVCEQLETSSKGLMDREVVRLITPGMIIEDHLLDHKSNNYIMAVAIKDGLYGLAFMDLSTASFRVTEADQMDEVLNEILTLNPSEILVPEIFKGQAPLKIQGHVLFSDLIKAKPDQIFSFLEKQAWNYQTAYTSLLDLFKTFNLEGFGCEHFKMGVCAAGALVSYAQENLHQKLSHLQLETYSFASHLQMDRSTCRNLELLQNLHDGSRQGTLISVLDLTLTSMGARLLKDWLCYPLTDIKAIHQRLDAIEEIKEKTAGLRQVRKSLKYICDLERLGSKITMGLANARDLLTLQKTLKMLPSIFADLADLKTVLFQFSYAPAVFEVVADLIAAAVREDAPAVINAGGLIRDGYHSELDQLLSINRDGKTWMRNLEAEEKDKTGINSLKVRYNKVLGYYIEVPKARASKVPDHYLRKQTLKHAERFITDPLKVFEAKVLNAEEQSIQLEKQIFEEIRTRAATINPELQRAARFLAMADCLAGLAEVAECNHYTRPVINTSGSYSITDGRHPVIETMLPDTRFVPNSMHLDNENQQVLIITGPNMAGKSTILRQAALITLMAHIGSFVPAAQASISITDRIFTRVGALDNLSQGQSTFLVEMQEVANILNHATQKSLVILDEIGRGTSTYDGLSIAWAVAEYLHDLRSKGVKTLFATHYHELTELSRYKTRVKNFNIAVKEWDDEIIFLRKMVEGGTNKSYGIQVARLAGVPAKVLTRSKKILIQIEKDKQRLNELPLFDQNQIKETPAINPEIMQLLAELRAIEIPKLTPLEALNHLSALRERAAQYDT